MSIVELGAAFVIAERIRSVPLDRSASLVVAGVLCLALLLLLALHAVIDDRRRLFSRNHRNGLHRLSERLRSEATVSPASYAQVARGTTVQGVTIGLSAMTTGVWHASVSLRGSRTDLSLLAELMACAFSATDAASAVLSEGGVLHAIVASGEPCATVREVERLGRAIWWQAARVAQSVDGIVKEAPILAANGAHGRIGRTEYFRSGPGA
jgi:hypothetical protein